MVFEVADPDSALCRFTREHAGARVVCRVVDAGNATGLFRATLTILAPSELGNELTKELRATREFDDIEVLSISPYAIMLKVTHRVSEARAAKGVLLQPAALVLDTFGADTLLEPFVGEAGRLRVRCLVPQPLDTKRALLRLQEMQRAVAWEHFRVIRVSEFKALKYADVLRRLLTPDEEDLLRLALSLGYYTSPKGCTLEDIAKRVGLSVSPVHKKLKAVEQILINSHVDPTTAQPPEGRRRLRGAHAGLAARLHGPPGSMSEVMVRLRWSEYPPLAFTTRHPGSRVIFQTLLEDPRAGSTTALMVVAADEREYRPLVEHYERLPDVQGVEITSRGADHVSLKLRAALPSPEAWRSSANPFAHLAHRFGRDAYVKPVVMEGPDLWLRFVIVRTIPVEEILQRLESAAKEGGWDEFEVVNVRRLDVDGAGLHLPQQEKMTARQEEVLKIAHALGYYKTPRECTLEDVAHTLGISANAIHKNLTAAEAKIISNYLSVGA